MPCTPQDVMDAVTKSNTETKNQLEAIGPRLETIEKKLAEPQRAPWVTSGPTGQDSQPYSMLRAVAFCSGRLKPEQCKNEIDLSNRLKSYLGKYGWTSHFGNSFCMPASSTYLPVMPGDDEGEKLQTEMREKALAWNRGGLDPYEAAHLARRANWNAGQIGTLQKAIGTISDAAGGVLVGFPTLGELIDIQRNLEVFANAGATEIGLPPNGRIQFPKLTGGATAYWVGEAASITDSSEATGYLDLIAHKLGVLVKMNNELIRYASPTAEAMVRMDMARVSARKADLGMLEGTGGVQIKGLLTYDTQTTWSYQVDKLIAITITANTLTPANLQTMIQALPDEVQQPNAFIMRRAMWAAIQNFRADAITTGDGAGQFLFSQFRDLGQQLPQTLLGAKVIASSQVSTTRPTTPGGAASTKSYVLTGNFADWIVARFGVMEFLASAVGDTPLQNDQTWLRGIQLLDAGPRHAASFVIADCLANNGGV